MMSDQVKICFTIEHDGGDEAKNHVQRLLNLLVFSATNLALKKPELLRISTEVSGLGTKSRESLDEAKQIGETSGNRASREDGS